MSSLKAEEQKQLAAGGSRQDKKGKGEGEGRGIKVEKRQKVARPDEHPFGRVGSSLKTKAKQKSSGGTACL